MIFVTVSGQRYKVEKLSPLLQFHITRRLGPLFASMGISLQALASGMALDLSDFIPLLPEITTIMARMKDEDVNYILFNCLAVVQREETVGANKAYAPVTNGTQFMYEMDMTLMLRLVVEVLKDSLQGFMKELGVETTSPSS